MQTISFIGELLAGDRDDYPTFGGFISGGCLVPVGDHHRGHRNAAFPQVADGADYPSGLSPCFSQVSMLSLSAYVALGHPKLNRLKDHSVDG